MRVVAVKALREFWSTPGHRDAEQPLRAWLAIVRASSWPNPTVIKTAFNSADILQRGRVIFDIGGNKYRLVAQMNFRHEVVYVRFIGTHAQYDRIDPQNV